MSADRPYFSVSYFCGSCPVSKRLHTGCVATRSVVIAENDPGRTNSKKGKLERPVASFNSVIFKNPGEAVEKLETYGEILINGNTQDP